MPYEIRALAEDDGCNSLSLGDPVLVPLKTFLRKEAKRLHKGDLAKTFVLVEAGETKVLAYVTLVCTHVAVEQFGAPAPVDGFRYAGWRQLPWPVDDNYLGRLRSEAGPVREAGLT